MENRTLVVSKLFSALNHQNKAKNIEISIYNWTLKQVEIKKRENYPIEKSWDNKWFKKIYFQKSRSILFNINNEKNDYFKSGIIDGTIKTKNIGTMSSIDIDPGVWTDTLERKYLKDQCAINCDKELLENTPEGPYTCDKCTCKKIVHFELQTRGADEPMTIFFTCLKCKYRWKDEGKS